MVTVLLSILFIITGLILPYLVGNLADNYILDDWSDSIAEAWIKGFLILCLLAIIVVPSILGAMAIG